LQQDAASSGLVRYIPRAGWLPNYPSNCLRPDGGGAGKGADLLLFVEGEQVGEGRTERSIPYLISLDETLDVGTDAGTPVTDDYPARGNEFNGTIKWLQVDLEPDDHSHMIDTDHMAHVRLVKQ
jgi:arylsulfatase